MTWTKHTYKRKLCDNPTHRIPSSSVRFEENRYELCTKTKLLLGSILLGSFAGLAYYFEWYKK